MDAAASPRILERARTRIQDCLSANGHRYCSRIVSPKLPTRVLDCDGSNTRLYLSKQGETGNYTALSYCWGSTQNFITTKSTLQECLQKHRFPCAASNTQRCYNDYTKPGLAIFVGRCIMHNPRRCQRQRNRNRQHGSRLQERNNYDYCGNFA